MSTPEVEHISTAGFYVTQFEVHHIDGRCEVFERPLGVVLDDEDCKYACLIRVDVRLLDGTIKSRYFDADLLVAEDRTREFGFDYTISRMLIEVSYFKKLGIYIWTQGYSPEEEYED